MTGDAGARIPRDAARLVGSQAPPRNSLMGKPPVSAVGDTDDTDEEWALRAIVRNSSAAGDWLREFAADVLAETPVDRAELLRRHDFLPPRDPNPREEA